MTIWKEPGTKPVLIMAVMVALFFAFAYHWAYGQEVSHKPVYWSPRFVHYLECDSAKMLLGYPDSTNIYDTAMLYPVHAYDSSVLGNDSVYADSVGDHWGRVWYWEAGSIDSFHEEFIYTQLGGYYTPSGTISSPTSPSLCTIYAYLKDNFNNPLVGAEVVAIQSSKYAGVDTSGGTSTIIPVIGRSVTTDTSGLFQLILRKTGDYTDTTKGFYDIRGTFAGESIFELKKFVVPDVSTLDIGDTILARGK